MSDGHVASNCRNRLGCRSTKLSMFVQQRLQMSKRSLPMVWQHQTNIIIIFMNWEMCHGEWILEEKMQRSRSRAKPRITSAPEGSFPATKPSHYFLRSADLEESRGPLRQPILDQFLTNVLGSMDLSKRQLPAQPPLST